MCFSFHAFSFWHLILGLGTFYFLNLLALGCSVSSGLVLFDSLLSNTVTVFFRSYLEAFKGRNFETIRRSYFGTDELFFAVNLSIEAFAYLSLVVNRDSMQSVKPPLHLLALDLWQIKFFELRFSHLII